MYILTSVFWFKNLVLVIMENIPPGKSDNQPLFRNVCFLELPVNAFVLIGVN